MKKNVNKDARELTSIINRMRVLGQNFDTIDKLKSEYVKAGGRIVGPVISHLVKNSIIIKKGKKFVFADYSKPIHFAGIAETIQKNRQNQLKYYQKKKSIISDITNVSREPVDDTQIMINTLKSRGYKILKPVVQYEEI